MPPTATEETPPTGFVAPANVALALTFDTAKGDEAIPPILLETALRQASVNSLARAAGCSWHTAKRHKDRALRQLRALRPRSQATRSE